MICKKCNTSGIKNEALGREFYYCRTCKEEINFRETKDHFTPVGINYIHGSFNSPSYLTQQEIDELFDAVNRGLI